MKSPIVQNADYMTEEVKAGYSELQVLDISPAGFYVGTLYSAWDGVLKAHITEPGTRDSGYFSTREEAQAYLDSITESGDTSSLREHP